VFVAKAWRECGMKGMKTHLANVIPPNKSGMLHHQETNPQIPDTIEDSQRQPPKVRTFFLAIKFFNTTYCIKRS
jgi:hypothetical protein